MVEDAWYLYVSHAYLYNSLTMTQYLVVVEQGATGYGAYVPDLPGCIAAGENHEEVLELIQEAIALHIEGLRAEGLPAPDPVSRSEYVELGAV